jgi:hypothetical protein
MTYTKKEVEYYNAHRDRTCADLSITKNQYNWFRRMGDKLHHIYELSCNGYMGNQPIYKGNKMLNEYTEDMYNRDTSFFYKLTDERAKKLQLHIFYQTDPRGATIYLSNQEIGLNRYNTDASCIY